MIREVQIWQVDENGYAGTAFAHRQQIWLASWNIDLLTEIMNDGFSPSDSEY